MRAERQEGRARHLRYLNPFPRNTGEVVRSYDKVLVPEINLGQLIKLIRADFLVDATGFNLVRGIPFRAGEVAGRDRRHGRRIGTRFVGSPLWGIVALCLAAGAVAFGLLRNWVGFALSPSRRSSPSRS